MKIKSEHYKYLESTITSIPGEQTRNHYNALKQSLPGKDISMRFRWDLFHYCRLDRYACDVLYKYLNDEHIDTALKKLVKDNPQLFSEVKP